MLARSPALLLTLAWLAATPLAAQDAKDKPKEPAKAQPSTLDKAGDTAGDIVEQPFKDINVVKDKIPQKLLDILDAPYDMDGMRTCAALKGEVKSLTEVLGPDVDSDEVRRKKGKTSASEFVFDGARSLGGGILPFSGIIRKISGAEAEQKRAQAAVLAGHVRRAYIKGLMRGRGCR